MFKSLKDCIEKSLTMRLGEEFDCDITLNEDDQNFKAYSVYIGCKELTFYTDKAVLNYDVNSMNSVDYFAVLNDIEMDDE